MKLNEITPKQMKCSSCSSCPAVFETDRDSYVLIGKPASEELTKMLKERVGKDEMIVEVPKGLLDMNLKS